MHDAARSAAPSSSSAIDRCRICKGPVAVGGPYEPFCSAQCKQVDLGRWATGKYAVSRPATEDDFQAADAARQPG